MTETEFFHRLAEANPWDEIVYHTGFLAEDRYIQGNPPDRRLREDLGRIANFAMSMANERTAKLFQRRVGDRCWEYLLVVEPRFCTQRMTA